MKGVLSGLVATCSGVNVHDTWIGVVIGILGAVGFLRSVLVYGECPPD
jgi:ammonia channel protein AmtB